MSLEKHTKKITVKHSEPTETACRAHFQMHVPQYVTLWHRLTQLCDIVTTFIGQKRQKSIIAFLYGDTSSQHHCKIFWFHLVDCVYMVLISEC